MSRTDWNAEADFLAQCVAYLPPLHFERFNRSNFCLRRYMRMQQRAAMRDGDKVAAERIRGLRVYFRNSVQS